MKYYKMNFSRGINPKSFSDLNNNKNNKILRVNVIYMY